VHAKKRLLRFWNTEQHNANVHKLIFHLGNNLRTFIYHIECVQSVPLYSKCADTSVRSVCDYQAHAPMKTKRIFYLVSIEIYYSCRQRSHLLQSRPRCTRANHSAAAVKLNLPTSYRMLVNVGVFQMRLGLIAGSFHERSLISIGQTSTETQMTIGNCFGERLIT
jgi:hypothetical protein